MICTNLLLSKRLVPSRSTLLHSVQTLTHFPSLDRLDARIEPRVGSRRIPRYQIQREQRDCYYGSSFRCCQLLQREFLCSNAKPKAINKVSNGLLQIFPGKLCTKRCSLLCSSRCQLWMPLRRCQLCCWRRRLGLLDVFGRGELSIKTLSLCNVEADKLCSSQLAWSLGRNSTGTTLLVPRKPCFFPSCSLGKHVCRWILNSQGSSSRETRFSRQSWQIPRHLGSYFATTRTYQLGFSL